MQSAITLRRWPSSALLFKLCASCMGHGTNEIFNEKKPQMVLCSCHTFGGNYIMSTSISMLKEAIEAAETDNKPTLSKSQQKKQKRREKYRLGQGERRKNERVKRKLKRKAQAEERLKGGDNAPAPYRRPTLMADSSNKFRVVIDMNFEEFMTDSEISKAVQQVGRIYAINRHSESPCQLYISSLKGKIRDRFDITNTGYKNWDVNCSENDYVSLFTETDNSGTDVNNQNFVYLSGDAGETLPDVGDILRDENKIYVIGGLVDHNRHKNLCHKMALERKIPTAKLPIKQYVTLCQRHILSTVTVFEIMLQVLGSHKSWPEALSAAIPKRKIATPSVPAIKGQNDETQVATQSDVA